RVAMIYNPDNPSTALLAHPFEASAETLAVQPIIVHIHGLGDIERAIETLAQQPGSGIFFPGDITLAAHYEQIVAMVARYRLPACNLSLPRVRDEWRVGLLRRGPSRLISTGCILRRPHPSGRKTQRPAISAANEIRARDQSEDGEGSRARDTTEAALHC